MEINGTVQSKVMYIIVTQITQLRICWGRIQTSDQSPLILSYPRYLHIIGKRHHAPRRRRHFLSFECIEPMFFSLGAKNAYASLIESKP